MKGNFKTLLKKFCLEGTILGLKYLYLYPDRVSRCFWAANLIFITYCACALTLMLYRRFDAMPTRITIENQYEALTSLPYASITICSPNQITISSMRHFNKTLIDGNETVNLEYILPQLLGYYELVSGLDTQALQDLQNLIVENRYTIPQVMGLLAQSCDEFLKVCLFRNKRMDCKELFRPILTRHGLCCAFNNVYYFTKRNDKDLRFKPIMATKRGLQDSLIVMVDYNPLDAIDKTILNAGSVRVMISDWSEFPADDETLLIRPHVEVFNALHGTYTYCSEEVSQLADWSRECNFEYENRLPYFNQYRNSDCDHLCYINAIEAECRCQPLFVPGVKNDRTCNVTKMGCVISVREKKSKAGDAECNCPRDCESRKYSAEMSIGNLDGLKHMISNPFADQNFTSSSSIMYFFFPSSVYVKKKQETVMSLISLASNLGGIFGLCLGCSVISVLEIHYYLFCGVRNYVKQRVRKALQEKFREYSQE